MDLNTAHAAWVLLCAMLLDYRDSNRRVYVHSGEWDPRSTYTDRIKNEIGHQMTH